VQDGDVLSRIVTVAHDGTDFNVAAEIRTEVDGTPGTDDMPTKVIIATTPTGSNIPVDNMIIDQAGNVSLPTGTLPSSDVNFIQVGTGAVASTAQEKLRGLEVSTTDFMTITEVADAIAGTALVDVTAAIQSAIDAVETAGGGIVYGIPGHIYRMASTGFTYSAAGVTENVGLEMKDGVIFDGRGCKFIRAGVSGDIVTNQFWIFGNKTVAATLEDFGVINATFENDGVANVYVNGVGVFAGNNTKAAGWIKRPVAKNLTGIGMRALVKSYDDDAASVVGKIYDGDYTDLHGIDAAATVIALQSDVGTNVHNISADTADFDIVDVFKGKLINISKIRGRNVSEFAVNIENQSTTGQILEDVTVSDVVALSGNGVRVAITGSSTGILRRITMDDIIVPICTVQQAASGTVADVTIDGIFHDSPSRGIFVSGGSRIKINGNVKNPTLAGCLVQNSPDCEVNGVFDLTGDTTNNCFELDRANGFRGDVRLLGGSDGLFLIGTSGSMGGASVHVVASGQNDKAVDYDGTTSLSHRVRVWGDYNGQATNYGNVEGSTIELEDREGTGLNIVSDELAAVFAKTHVINAETGTSDNLQDINSGIRGQEVTLIAQVGDTITVKHATGGGNIRTLTAGDFIITTTIPIRLRFNGTQWTQI
jgi:hypothetical protein